MILGFVLLFFLMRRRPPRSTRTDTLFPYTTLFRSRLGSLARHFRRYPGNDADFPKYPPARTIAIRHSTPTRSEEHTSELQSLMRTSYAVFCLKKKTNESIITHTP